MIGITVAGRNIHATNMITITIGAILNTNRLVLESCVCLTRPNGHIARPVRPLAFDIRT